jgi:maltose O-acetyltransferase
MTGWLIDMAARAMGHLNALRTRRRWSNLQALGMKIGRNVLLPDSTWIDVSHCFLIEIGDDCGLGEQCMLLAHDAQMDEFLDAARVGRIRIRPSCHIGSRTVILPGVDIGPRTVVGANSVVSKSLPPETVCAGAPAKVICTLEEYLRKHRQRLARLPNFEYLLYDIRSLTEERKTEIIHAVASQDAYIVGGHSAELRGEGGTLRTAARVRETLE